MTAHEVRYTSNKAGVAQGSEKAVKHVGRSTALKNEELA
jgi:hypothetical protein